MSWPGCLLDLAGRWRSYEVGRGSLPNGASDPKPGTAVGNSTPTPCGTTCEPDGVGLAESADLGKVVPWPSNQMAR